MKYTIIVDEYRAMEENYKVGDKVLVTHMYHELVPNDEGWWDISKKHAEEGYPGNMDHTVKRFHGWRGTYNNVSTNAMGVYEIKKVQELEDYRVKVTLGRKDWKKGEE